ncbi:hypothetical protein HU200_015302 [Digitaria exilis]|uniref:Glycosyltransferase n=1 Tax=Digitaria exilis TaxID=1010633 RepID=A0A835FA63_9POAL|nr:hypothetical protein HU200_015302 [Digitaria exilis]CAB3469574.1 unnamed protein product [Digitaria exilis]
MATADAARPATRPAGSIRDHIVVFPFMAKGHTLPLLHLASALAGRAGLRVTVLTTPGNLAFARRRVPAHVALVALPFPSHPDLPPGAESTDALPSHALFPAFLRATALLRDPFAAYLASLPSPPLAVVSDFFLGFTQRVATDAGVLRLTFHGMSAFSLALCFSLATNPPPPPPPGSAAAFRVPGFPETVTITVDEVPHAVAQAADVDDPVTRFLLDEVRDWDYRSWGVLVNSFDALDGDYAGLLESFYLPGARAWLVGPLFLAAGESQEQDDEDPEGCLPWLDERASRSVVYVSFGTQVHVSAAQLDELAHGLVDSGHAFLWAVRCSDERWSPPVDVGPEGKIVRGWVPQRRVLAHTAVGGFVSHCGWNSVLESLAAGRPMLAWPVMAEQAANAKHVADVLRAGVRVGVKAGGANAGPEVVVDRVRVAGKVREVMDGGEAGRRMRDRAEHVAEAARAAVGEGGTSRVALRRMVDELRRSYDDDGEAKV